MTTTTSLGRRFSRSIQVASSRKVLRSSLGIALFVGTTLNIINQWSSLMAGGSGISISKLFMNYLVPYLVATYSATLAVLRSQESAPKR